MVYIYILELQDSKYYVGKSNDPDARIDSHFGNNGAAWTTKYPPVKILEVVPDCDEYDEDKYILKYMEQFGIDNVRGDSYCTVTLDPSTKTAINRMLDGANNRCYQCGASDHFVQDCTFVEVKPEPTPKKKGIWGFLSRVADGIEKLLEDNSSSTSDRTNRGLCYRCGRRGHFVKDCYANKHVKGYYLK